MVFLVLILMYWLVMWLLACGWKRLETFETTEAPTSKVSVIIPFRNEAKNIENCLKSILNQNLSKEQYEIILVNDHSTDEGAAIVEELLTNHVKLLHLPEEQQGKKAALTMGIQQAQYELIITSDADCTYDPQWLSTMLSYYEKKQSKLIIGPVLIEGKQAAESVGLGITTGAMCYYQKPMMCNGANLAFPKSVFEEVKGYEGVEDIPTGDDVFLLEKVKERYPKEIHFLKAPTAIVQTKPAEKFIQQRVRWASKALRVNDVNNVLLGFLILLVNLNVLIALLFFFKSFHFILLAPFLIKTLIDHYLLNEGAAFYGKYTNLIEAFTAQFKNIIYVPLVAILSLFGKYSWKGRNFSKV